jgi:hypothetical protein
MLYNGAGEGLKSGEDVPEYVEKSSLFVLSDVVRCCTYRDGAHVKRSK